MLLPGITTDEAKALIMSVGTHRGQRSLSPVEVAKIFSKAILHGASREQCAEFVHLKGPDMISRFLRLIDLSSMVQLSVDWRQTGPTISFTSAWRLSDYDKDEQEKACLEIMANQLTTKEVEQVVQLRQRSGRSFSDCTAEVVQMRPKIEKIHVIIGAITNTRVKEWLSNMSQARRDSLFSDVLPQAYPNAIKCSGRLGIDRFTIITDKQGYDLVNPGNKGTFEVVITQTIEREMNSGL